MNSVRRVPVKWMLGWWLLCGQAMAQTEIGSASYYADTLHGNPTASGEPYNRDALTAAHRTLPFGTRVRVSRLEGGQSVIVRINDRGPHVEDRIIDLSGAAAEALGLLEAGTAEVQIEVIDD